MPWAGFFLIGMWAGRLKLSEQRIQIRLAIGGAALSVATGLAASYIGSIDPSLVELTRVSPIPPGPFYMLAAAASSLSAIGLILLITPALTNLHLTPWLAAAGRQSLTLYIAHILIGMGILEALGWLDGRLTQIQIFSLSIGFCLIAALYARLWSSSFRRGPLESLMRRLAG